MEVRKYRILKFGRFYQIGVCIAERIRRESALRNYTHNFAFVTVHTNAILETIRISIADLIGGERQHRRLPRAANTTVPAVHKSRRRQPSSPPLVSSHHPARLSVDAGRLDFHCRRSTGMEQSAIPDTPSFLTFRRQLKTFLFTPE